MNAFFKQISFKYDNLNDSVRFFLFIVPFTIGNMMFQLTGETFHIRNYIYYKLIGGTILMFYILWGLHRAFGKSRLIYNIIFYTLIAITILTMYINFK